MKNDKTIHIRLSNSEYESLIAAAKQCGMTVSSLGRKMISEKIFNSEQLDLKVRQDVTRELYIMCNAVNVLRDKVGNDYPQICEILAEGAGRIYQFLK